MTGGRKWWAIAGGTVIVAAAGAVSVAGIMAAGSINEANDAQAFTRQVNDAAAGIERAWAGAVHADALAVSGSGPKAQARFAEARDQHAAHAATLSALGVDELDQVVAAADAGYAALEESMNATIAILEADGAMAAYTNHTERSLAVSASMAPLFAGLGEMVKAADAEVASAFTGGASTLRAVSAAGAGAAAAGFALLGVAVLTGGRPASGAAGSKAQQDAPVKLSRAA
jgi:hypothetical protein